MANLKDAFIIRPLPESDEFIITIGNHLATEEKFKSRKAAEMRINKTDWNLVSALFYALKEADKWVEENPELIKKTEKPKSFQEKLREQNEILDQKRMEE